MSTNFKPARLPCMNKLIADAGVADQIRHHINQIIRLSDNDNELVYWLEQILLEVTNGDSDRALQLIDDLKNAIE